MAAGSKSAIHSHKRLHPSPSVEKRSLVIDERLQLEQRLKSDNSTGVTVLPYGDAHRIKVLSYSWCPRWDYGGSGAHRLSQRDGGFAARPAVQMFAFPTDAANGDRISPRWARPTLARAE
jgi:hypothetical protein